MKKTEKLLRDELYVMLMLQRSEANGAGIDCDDTDVVLACLEDLDNCPAACKAEYEDEGETSDEVVKSGDLAVTAKAAEGKKALIGGTSDLDTLTFKTSEEVTISSITLERYGYSTKEQVDTVQLEDEDGNIIADAKEINNKGQVKLTLKKDYKTVDGTYRATIVLNAKDLGNNNGSTIGFKVVAAESTAKNLNLDDYDPYTYDLVNYKGSAVEFSDRNSDKTYNWESGELYEVAKFRVKAPADANILIKGFTLTDSNKNKIEADKYAKDVTVTVDGKEVDGLKWNINKDDELVVSFNEVEVEGKKTVSIAVNMSFNEEFDNFNEYVEYGIAKLSNFNATDKKTGTRVSESTVKPLSAVNWAKYTFKGGKVKLTGTKLGTVNAAANATNVKVAEGEITITEALKGSAQILVKENDFIDAIRLDIAGEEYDGSFYGYGFTATVGGNTYDGIVKVVSSNTTTTTVEVVENEVSSWIGKKFVVATVPYVDGLTIATVYESDGTTVVPGLSIALTSKVYKFTGLEIERSGKVEVRVDLKDTADGTMKFAGSLNSSSFDLQYEESRETVGSQMVGSISVSDIKAQAAKASLENKNTKEVELIKNETNRKTIFDGTYEAKKGAVTLKNFTIISTAGTIAMSPAPTFYVTIDGEEYDADWSTVSNNAKGDIDNIEVADGKSINVKVEIEVAPTVDGTADTFNIKLEGEDVDNNPAGQADDDTVKVKTVLKGTLNVNSSARNTVLLKSDRSLAEFTIKPSKAGDDSVTLDNIAFLMDGVTDATTATAAYGTPKAGTTPASPKLKVVIDGDDISNDFTIVGNYVNYNPEISIPSEGVVVKVSFKSEQTGEKKITLTHVNKDASTATNESRSFQKLYLPAILKITQEKKGDVTKYNIDVEKDESSTVVEALNFYVEDGVASTSCTFTTINAAPTNCEALPIVSGILSDTDNSGEAVNGEAAKSIKGLSYKIGTTTYYISRAVYEDYFKVNGGDYLMVFSNK